MSESLLAGESQETEETQETQTQETQTQEAPARPDWLPEKYKTAEDLAKAYKELETKLGAKEEDLRARLTEELTAERMKDRPASAGEYTLPDFVDEADSVDNELLKWWSEHSFENGYGQDKFEQGLKMYMEAIGTGPDLAAEAKKLGDNANQRIEAAALFARKSFPSEIMPAIERMCETSDGIVALEHIMEMTKGTSVSSTADRSQAVTEADLREMMRDERYWKQGSQDAAFVKQVEDGFKQLYRG